MLLEAGKGAGSVFERDAGVVLRRIEAAREARASNPSDRRAFLDCSAASSEDRRRFSEESGAAPDEPRLIVP